MEKKCQYSGIGVTFNDITALKYIFVSSVTNTLYNIQNVSGCNWSFINDSDSVTQNKKVWTLPVMSLMSLMRCPKSKQR